MLTNVLKEQTNGQPPTLMILCFTYDNYIAFAMTSQNAKGISPAATLFWPAQQLLPNLAS